MDGPGSYALFARRCRGEAPSAHGLARRIPAGVAAEALGALPEVALWERHEVAMRAYREALGGGEVPAPMAGQADLLQLKAALAERLLAPCRLCWLRCPVDRTRGERGRCGLGTGLRVYRDVVHLGEELELIPTHALFLAGCNYRCAYCSEWEHVDAPQRDPEVDLPRLAASIDARRGEGARSLTVVGGTPEVSLPGVLAALLLARADTPLVWNANLSASAEARELLEGVVSAWVADLKYGNERCSAAGSAAPAALAQVHAGLLRARGEAWLIVRHLVLPGHLECCTLPALAWLAAQLPGVRVNLMPHYQPTAEVRGTAWDQRPSPAQLERARAEARRLGLDLDGPGPAPELGAGPGPGPRPAPPVVPFESRLRLDPAGGLVIEDLTPELAALAGELGGDDPELRLRLAAGAPWSGSDAGSKIEPQADPR